MKNIKLSNEIEMKIESTVSVVGKLQNYVCMPPGRRMEQGGTTS